MSNKTNFQFPWEQQGVTFEEWKRQQTKQKELGPKPFFGGPGGSGK